MQWFPYVISVVVNLELKVNLTCCVFKKATARTLMMTTMTTVSFMLIIRVIFFLNKVLALCITANFPCFAAIFNVGACKFDSVLSEIIV